jgi:trigger factor
MNVSKKQISGTKVELTVSASETELQEIKHRVVELMSKDVRVPGFRQGKAPSPLAEKQLDPNRLQTEFIDQAANKLYVDAVNQENLRPAGQPNVNLTKFVQYSTLEFTAVFDVVGDIKLADYKKIRPAKKDVKVTEKDVDDVLAQLQNRYAARKDVTRAAKSGDEVTIDFAGSDSKTNQPIAGADAKKYQLILGSDSFIPGFEKNIIGMKAGEEKSFELSFPKDYGIQALQNRQVTFSVTVEKVQSLDLPKLDDTFAAQAGPFKSLDELRKDIKTQLQAERQQEADRAYENDLLEKITAESTVEIPEALIGQELTNIERDEQQNAAYRGQTWDEYLAAQGTTNEQWHKDAWPTAELRVKASLVLAEIAEKEGLTVSAEELDARLQQIRTQYTDAKMREELDKPESRRDIASRVLSEKTIAKLVEYATAT